MEIIPIVFIKNRVLHIRISIKNKAHLQPGGTYFLRTSDKILWNIIIISRIVTADDYLYPFTLCGKDPVQFLNEVCRDRTGSKKQRIVVDLLDANSAPVEGIPKLELHPL